MAGPGLSALRRVPVDALPEEAATLRLPAPAQQHLRVLRLGPGDALLLFDGRGGLAEARLEAGGTARVKRRFRAEPDAPLGLVMGMPKGKKAGDVVRQATEIGATEIVFFQGARSVATPDAARAAKRRARWATLATEAARQAERAWTPAVRGPVVLDEALAARGAAPGFVCGARQDGPRRPSARGWVAVGPEGGLSAEELRAFRDAGWTPLSLGPTVLRAETAAVAALALLAAAR
ncbi:MAG: RsmE family RNA methyltransferase [Myxococcota bacterium]